MMIGYSVPLYNSCLNIFYVITIQYDITAQGFAKFEPVLSVMIVIVSVVVVDDMILVLLLVGIYFISFE